MSNINNSDTDKIIRPRKKIVLPESDKDLLLECKVSSFRASGSGGQNVNVTDSAVRVVHLPTGITVTARRERSQYLNKKNCLSKIRKIVEKLNYRPPQRVATSVPKSVKRRNLAEKSLHSQKKQLRGKKGKGAGDDEF